MDEYADVVIFGNNKENEFIGYITWHKKNRDCDLNNIINIADVTFEPLNILGDLRYISEDMHFEYDSGQFPGLYHSIFSPAPYDKEYCIDMSISDPIIYFSLLDCIKKNMNDDKIISYSDIIQMQQYFQLNPLCCFYNITENDNNSEREIYTPLTLYHYKIDEVDKLLANKHLFRSACSSSSEIIFSIFYYLLLHNFHFYKCKFCQKYSAIQRKQGKEKYCQRKNFFYNSTKYLLDENIINKYKLNEYKNLTCKDTVKKLHNRIRQRKKTIDSRLRNDDSLELDNFLNGYALKNKAVIENPSINGFIELLQYVEESSNRTRKKKNQ